MSADHFVVFDLEATPDPECPADPPKNPDQDRVPAPPHHRVVSCGIIVFAWTKDEQDNFLTVAKCRLLGDAVGTETSILQDFGSIMKHRPHLASWNGRGFDLPVIMARSFRCGIPTPWFWDRDYMDRFRGHRHIDLQDHTTNYGASRASRMAAFAKLAGWPGKLGVCGADVPQLWEEGDEGRAKVRRYNLEDVGCQSAILLRVLLMKGEISRTAYQKSAESLLSTFDRDQRFAELSAAIDRDRFLMHDKGPQQQPVPAESGAAA
ncbi:hypothetical protein EKK58_05495 [Candidatus Dependentiae bacterium]|nr:MAG: hypothetical protein EKK58_05495 [Candidatus Dependentiae bacterium]